MFRSYLSIISLPQSTQFCDDSFQFIAPFKVIQESEIPFLVESGIQDFGIRRIIQLKESRISLTIDPFTDTAAILNLFDLRSIMGCPRGMSTIQYTR